MQPFTGKGKIMTTKFTISVVTAMMLCFPFVARSEDRGPQDEHPVADPASGTKFSSSSACTESSPCQNITGEVLKIEERYLVRESNGREISMKVTRDTHMKALPKVGDSIAAQLNSTGEVQSITKMPKTLDRKDIPVPSETQGGLR
jgi:hypothetical protein